MEYDRQMKIAYIGNGKSTNRYHIPFVLKHPEIMQIKYIYRRNPDHDKWKKVDGIEYICNLEQILKDPEINLVVVCTGHDSHFAYAKMILDAGKNCMVEKPFMENTQQAKEIFALADAKGLFCSAYQNRRYDSDFLTVQKVIETGKLGELLELEMHFDYYRPEVPEAMHEFNPIFSYLYGHGSHTLDQVISYFGRPDRINYDVRQLLGNGRMNDYYDIDLYYGKFKISVKSSYFRVKARPSFVVYGKKGMFVKESKDKQEEDLKRFYMPNHDDFGMDLPQDYGTLIYYDEQGQYHEEKVVSERGDYSRVYTSAYETIMNGHPQVVTHEQTLLLMEMLENGIKGLK